METRPAADRHGDDVCPARTRAAELVLFDYTFGIWRGNEIVPVGKAYSGFSDEELRDLDKWVRGHTVNRFGPVREVEKQLVVELAFDSAHESPRHKSGIALRFPRVSRIRWDKPAGEADTIETVRKLIDG